MRAAVDRGEPVTEFWTPMTAIINTRSAHGVLGMDELRIALDGAMPKCTRGQDPRVAAASWKVCVGGFHPRSHVTCISRPRVRPITTRTGID